MLPNRSVCTNSSLFDSFQPVLFGQCYGVNREETDFLGRGKAAALCRLVSTVFWTIAYTIMLLWILSHPYDVHVLMPDEGIYNLPLGLKVDHLTMTSLLILIICLGWIPLLLDVITATVKYRCSSNNNLDQEEMASFWDGAILLEGMKYCCRCCSYKN